MRYALADVPLFSGLDEAALERLVGVMEERRLEPGELVFAEGSTGDEFYVIVEGQVTVSKLIDRDEGREKTLATLGRGDFFGEMALIEDKPRSAFVRTTGPTTLLVLTRATFQELLGRESEVAASLLFCVIRTVSGRLRRTSTELVALYETGKLAGAVTDLPTLAAKILERLRESLGAQCGLVLVENHYTGVLKVQDAQGFEPGVVAGLDIAKTKGLVRELVEGRRPFLFNAWRPVAGVGLHGFERPQMLGAPLIAGERAIGAIVLGDPPEGQPFDMNHLNLVLGVAMQVAAAIENARLSEEEAAKKRHERHFVTF